MAARSLEQQVDSLLSRKVAERRASGLLVPEVEAAALFESIALSLLLTPRAVLYVALLARNGLVAAIKEEIALITALRSVIADLGNTTVAIKDTRSLQKAKTALLQMETQQKVVETSPPFKRFAGAVDDFLQKQLAKNVRRPGQTELVRPGSEAATTLPTAFADLDSKHSEVLDRMYALAVGVDNFLSAPLSTIIGLSTSARIREDIEDIIELLEEDDSGSQSRDIAVRLISAKATLASFGTALDVSRPLVDTATLQPPGHELYGASDPAAPFVQSSVGPFVLPTAANITVTTPAGSVTVTNFPQVSVNRRSNAAVTGSVTSFPITASPGESLFVRVVAKSAHNATFSLQPDGTFTSSDGTLGALWEQQPDGTFAKTIRLNLNTGAAPTSLSLAIVLAALNADPLLLAKEYITAGTGRIFILSAFQTYLQSISIAVAYQEPTTTSVVIAGVPTVVPSTTVVTSSAHTKLGFVAGQVGVDNEVPVTEIVDGLNLLSGGLITATAQAGGVRIVSAHDSPGSTLSLAGTAATAIGVAGTHTATSNTFRLFGNVRGTETDPVNPVPLIDVGDSAVTPTGSATVASLTATRIVLSQPVPTFSGPITVTSALHATWAEFDPSMQSAVSSWLSGPFASNLTKLDQALSPLFGSPTPAQRNFALDTLSDLESRLQVVLASLLAGVLSAGAAQDERALVQGIVEALTERKYDRAVDYFLRCQVYDMLLMDWQTASFSGSLMKSMSDVARSDLKFPNRAKNEGYRARVRREDMGLPR